MRTRRSPRFLLIPLLLLFGLLAARPLLVHAQEEATGEGEHATTVTTETETEQPVPVQISEGQDDAVSLGVVLGLITLVLVVVMGVVVLGAVGLGVIGLGAWISQGEG
ncbi:MAG: hypothetical protein KC418_14775 [Anaerolineales bacterium]|nr:hypothetical protein [Anaerolineales bacterium]MCB8952904.1 hypothetical protein [Ardenticatenales bacterium]